MEIVPNYKNILKNESIILEFLKYKYKIVKIGVYPEENITIAIDESLIAHDNGNQILFRRL